MIDNWKDVRSDYLHCCLAASTSKLVVHHLARLIKVRKMNFDTIVFRGMSGALIAPTIAHKLNKNLLLVRKKDEGRHSTYEIEGFTNIKKFIIIDDIICSGNTVAQIFKSLSAKDIDPTKCQSLVLYNSDRMDFTREIEYRNKEDKWDKFQLPITCMKVRETGRLSFFNSKVIA